MEENNLVITGADKSNLLETARWGKFLGIVGFIMSGLVLLIAIFMIVGLSSMDGSFNPGWESGIGFLYFPVALLYIFPSLYLYRFSVRLNQGIKSMDQESCSSAYLNLKKLFVFMGVMTIIVLALYALAILFVIMGGVMGGML
ncbi:hypothetical protein [Ekhidna sp.]|uniref:hypothetical protein n=1 Tax=Ekhidna sp. TaxID=2608089 RepID=UPI003CCBE2FC